MKITICGNLNFAKEIIDVGRRLREMGHEVLLPMTAELIEKGEVSQEFIRESKNSDAFAKFSMEKDATKIHFDKIKESDAILVLNYEKKGILNYIGAAVFLEMGVAYALDEKIFMLNPIPDIALADDIKMLKPIIINGDLSLIK